MSDGGSSELKLSLLKDDSPEDIGVLLMMHSQYIKGLVAGNGPADYDITTTVLRKS